MTEDESSIRVVPANEASWEDLQTVFGTRAIEGYPVTTKTVMLEELLVGSPSMFADAGFIEVRRPTLRRIVMRIDF